MLSTFSSDPCSPFVSFGSSPGFGMYLLLVVFICDASGWNHSWGIFAWEHNFVYLLAFSHSYQFLREATTGWMTSQDSFWGTQPKTMTHSRISIFFLYKFWAVVVTHTHNLSTQELNTDSSLWVWSQTSVLVSFMPARTTRDPVSNKVLLDSINFLMYCLSPVSITIAEKYLLPGHVHNWFIDPLADSNS